MTTIMLTPELERVVAEQARRQTTTSEEIVLNMLREKFSPAPGKDAWEPQDDWERRLHNIGFDAGVSLTDHQVSREVMYEDHD